MSQHKTGIGREEAFCLFKPLFYFFSKESTKVKFYQLWAMYMILINTKSYKAATLKMQTHPSQSRASQMFYKETRIRIQGGAAGGVPQRVCCSCSSVGPSPSWACVIASFLPCADLLPELAGLWTRPWRPEQDLV